MNTQRLKDLPFTPFIIAGLSNMTGSAVTNPFDVIKVRLQLEGELSKGTERHYKGTFRGIWTVIKDEGIAGIYKGLPASLIREAVYSGIRLGAYEPLKSLFGATDASITPLWMKICAASLSGAIGSAIANPVDIIKIRMQGRHTIYKNVFDAFYVIGKTEGIKGFYRAVIPSVQRAALLTAVQIPAYDHTKHILLNNVSTLHEGITLHFISSMIAGFLTAVATCPIDVIKTRLMNQTSGIIYKNALDCSIKSVKAEGIRGLYKGLIPHWLRLGPHTCVTFLVFERLRSFLHMDPM
eukprot:TRINITY_DN1162_c0_g1_i1.p1 TRINITY_DN1162_c0_g1~~TRINITY_DN1162_c0_g1_i1.p1  ORF type:complete len:295 (+),score=19.29 TRINITY_DN1162_c0_g1_i1:132-1016(+)